MTGRLVYFDDCRRSDGTLIEVKGPGFDKMLSERYFAERKKFPDEWTGDAMRQVRSAGSRDIEWYFAEPEAAEVARRTFEQDDRLSKIRVFYVPVESP